MKRIEIEVDEIELGMIIQGLDKMQRYLSLPKCTDESQENAKRYGQLSKELYLKLLSLEE